MRIKKDIVLVLVLAVFAAGQFVFKGGHKFFDLFSRSPVVSVEIKKNINSVRSELAGNLPALEIFDYLTREWLKESKKTGGFFDVAPLFTALEMVPMKSNVLHSLERTKMLWQEGNVRSSAVLASALIYDLDIPVREIELQLGKKIALYVSDLQQEEAVDPEFVSEGARVVKLVEELYRLRHSGSNKEEAMRLLEEYGSANLQLEKEISKAVR